MNPLAFDPNKKYKITNENFNKIFGGEGLVKHFPELLTTGVKLVKNPENMQYSIDDDFYYILHNNKMYDSCFFSEEEIEFLEVVCESLRNKK